MFRYKKNGETRYWLGSFSGFDSYGNFVNPIDQYIDSIYGDITADFNLIYEDLYLNLEKTPIGLKLKEEKLGEGKYNFY